MLARRYCDATKSREMIFFDALSPAMNAGHPTPSHGQSEQARTHNVTKAQEVRDSGGRVNAQGLLGPTTAVHYIPKRLGVNSTSYCNLLKNHLKPAVRSKRRRLLGSRALLQHDNARPTAVQERKKSKDCGSSVFCAHPTRQTSHRAIFPYSDPQRGFRGKGF